MKYSRFTIPMVLLIALLITQIAQAKEIAELTLSGTFFDGEITITDKSDFDTIINFVSTGRYQPGLPQPPVGRDSLRIAMGVSDGKQIVATTVMRYYPGLNGEAGYLYYEDVINGSASAEGNWFLVVPAREEEFRLALSKYGIGFSQDGIGQISSSYAAVMGTLAELDKPQITHLQPNAGKIIARSEAAASVEGNASELGERLTPVQADSPAVPQPLNQSAPLMLLALLVCLTVFAAFARRTSRRSAAA